MYSAKAEYSLNGVWKVGHEDGSSPETRQYLPSKCLCPFSSPIPQQKYISSQAGCEEDIFFSRGRCTSKVCSLPYRLREKMNSSVLKGTLGFDDTDLSRVYPFFTVFCLFVCLFVCFGGVLLFYCCCCLFVWQHYNFSDLVMVLLTAQGTSAIAHFKKFDPTFEKQHHI